ncbi:MAG: FAD/NAD(P)-binding oxidoreductase [Pseudonocardiaceae bacterium]
MAASRFHHRIVIVGGGTAGITVAARLRRAGEDDLLLLEPAKIHWYQPLFTLVGAGLARMAASCRPEVDVMPQGVQWMRDAAVGFEPERSTVITSRGLELRYDALVVCPGLHCDWDAIPGLPETLGRDGLSSNYRPDLAPLTWSFLRDLRGGTAVFTMPSGPVKCGGAGQKIAYLAADWYRRRGVLDSNHLVLVVPGNGLFGVPEFAVVLQDVVRRYGIDVHFEHELMEVDPKHKEVILADRRTGRETKRRLRYDVAHVIPPQRAPDSVSSSPLADPGDPRGFVEADRYTLQHPRYPNVFTLGDVASAPNSKTGAAVRKQAPVVVDNLQAALAGRPVRSRYDGYSSCPITTARNRVLLAEFDYSLRPHKTLPFINTQQERYDMWLLKRYGLPFIYWHFMLRGLA